MAYGNTDVLRVLEEQNPWLAVGRVPSALAPPVERPLAQRLWREVLTPDRPHYPFVLGPRRVGKTTVMYQTVRRLLDAGVDRRRLWWVRLDHPMLMRVPLDELVRAILYAAGPVSDVHLFLDELVYAEDWDLWLKTFYDDRWPVRIVATASATAALRHRRLESGIGRWSEQYLPPYLFSEFLDLTGNGLDVPVGATLAETLDALAPDPPEARLAELRRRFLLVGGFPELLIADQAETDNEDYDRLLRSQQVLRSDAVERAVYKDIPQSFGLDNPLALERLLYVLAGQITGVLSPSAICADLGLSQPTFDRYLSYLERAFLVFTLPNYSGSERTVQRRGRKLYFVDSAIRNAALQRGLAPLNDPVELGHLIENLVAANLHALAMRTGVRLFHWRERRDEVDLVFDHPSEPLAVEVGSSVTHDRRGLFAFMRRHPRFDGRCWLVAPDARLVPPATARDAIGTVPLDTFLVAVGRQLERALDERLPL